MWVDKPFDAAKIRDTNPHYAWWRTGYPDNIIVPICLKGYRKATIAIDNGLDVNVIIIVQGSHQPYFDKAPHLEQVWNITSEIIVPKGERKYVVIDDPFPHIRITVKAVEQPTSGRCTSGCLKKDR